MTVPDPTAPGLFGDNVSPGLAPMEHALDELSRRFRDHNSPPANLQDMGQFILAQWQAILQD